MRQNFEAAATDLFEVNTYRQSQRAPGPCGAKIFTSKGINFKAGCGSTGFDIWLHSKIFFRKLSDNQNDELMVWFKTDEGKRARKTSNKKRNSNRYDRNTNTRHGGGGDGNCKKKFKKAIKSLQDLKSVMSILAEK